MDENEQNRAPEEEIGYYADFEREQDPFGAFLPIRAPEREVDEEPVFELEMEALWELLQYHDPDQPLIQDPVPQMRALIEAFLGMDGGNPYQMRKELLVAYLMTLIWLPPITFASWYAGIDPLNTLIKCIWNVILLMFTLDSVVASLDYIQNDPNDLL